MKKIRMGIVGGGKGSFIGMVHRTAATMDGLCELVCGVFSRDQTNNQLTGESLGISDRRIYANYQDMIAAESALPVSERMDFIVIATPNNTHWPIAKLALEAGFHVMSEKPATFDVNECQLLNDLVLSSSCLYALAHVYTGYPLVKEARHRVSSGDLGVIRKIVVEYSQDWLAHESCEQSKQASWRLDSEQSGQSCCIGDIGIHAINLAEYITGMQVTHLCADMDNIVNGRELDDDAHVLLKFDHKIKGLLLASQVAVGEENNLHIRVYGDKASLEWCQQDSNKLYFKPWSQAVQIITTGSHYLSQVATQHCRLPSGHPEGYIEAFANVYRNFFAHIRAQKQKSAADHKKYDYPGIDDALRGMKFIDAVVESGNSDSKWFLMR